eukprot:CAMPEP_0197187598 /NCGR_PEP_ID=MMETSP1423-20130617/16165_1 /TAXON_ID=476441 /ORGANISM="Pseudo-nitzschia heimii, Strain UNC1101" /LENGTH=338 /DNA_ID=CAMNT_0042639225 /DNA_START=212 /DNA_END=1228 /DNA_ORIENTATION=+
MTGTLAIQTTNETSSKKKRNAGERIQRSRERNRIHARKTRQRKKEQLQSLQNKAEQLKSEQISLKLSINEKNTANILCCLFSNNQGSQGSSAEDPNVEALLTRPEEDIPDPTKLPALQPLILPSGAQHSKRNNVNAKNSAELQQPPNDGIDYELLGKDRSKCTPLELDQIRRERNRMHAKRTRDRKRLFMEEMAEMCKVLEGENLILQQHLNELNGVNSNSEINAPPMVSIATISPSLSPTIAPKREFFDMCNQGSSQSRTDYCHESVLPLTSQNGASFDQMKTLLDAAGVFDPNSDANLDKNKSCTVSVSSEDHIDLSARPAKKQRQLNCLDKYVSD